MLDNDWSLGICCYCPRPLEMKVEEIEVRFGAHRRLRLVDLLPKLTCGEPKGCGSNDMVLFLEGEAEPRQDQGGGGPASRASFLTG